MGRPDNILRLRDGRLLGYGDYGDAAGVPLFFFPGFPGSRLQASGGDEPASRLGVRLVAPERPGMGLSDFKPERSMLDWADDVVELADALGLDRFGVGGVSGGAPYALACAYKIPRRLTVAGIISGLGPLDTPEALGAMAREGRILFDLTRRLPPLANATSWAVAQVVEHWPERYLERMVQSMPECDRQILARPEVRQMVLADTAEAFRQGGRGLAREAVLYSRPWGFRLEDIRMPVQLWQGDADLSVPLSMARAMASAIPDCRATYFPGEGHFFLVDRMEEILRMLVAATRGESGSPAPQAPASEPPA